MAIYWILFLIPALGVLLGARRLESRMQFAIWMAVWLFFAMVIGLRDRVGADWFTYVLQFEIVKSMSFSAAVTYNDPGYYAVGWLVAHMGGSIYGADFICACCLTTGVVVFARAQPRPWLALLVAVPYLITVVAMGYTRQSVALGFVMIGLTALGRQRMGWFVFWVLLAALFHKTAVILLPIAALAASERRVWTFIWVGVVALMGAYLLLRPDTENLWTNYVTNDMQSQGGAIRVAMNALPAALLLWLRPRLGLERGEYKLWWWIALASLLCVPLVVASSTAVDRMALYFLPIQMFVFTRLPRLGATTSTRTTLTAAVVAYYFAVDYVWLHFANHAKYWVPYHFMPLH